jgi:uncharacterized membrane protein
VYAVVDPTAPTPITTILVFEKDAIVNLLNFKFNSFLFEIFASKKLMVKHWSQWLTIKLTLVILLTRYNHVTTSFISSPAGVAVGSFAMQFTNKN